MLKDNIKVLFLTNIPSPYMVGYLNELGRFCNLTVIFEKDCDSTRPNSWRRLLDNVEFNAIVLNGHGIDKKFYGDTMDSAPDDKALSFDIFKYLKDKYDFIIVANPCTPTGILAIGYLRLYKIPYGIQSEGGYPGNGKGIKEKLKYWLMSQAEFYLSTCDMDDRYFIQYGATKERIKRYPFASISRKDLPDDIIGEGEKLFLRKQMRVDYKKIILSVGRSVYVKGFDILLKASKNLPEDVCVIFVGGKCLPEYEKIIEEDGLRNIIFVDNVEMQELINFYKMADIFVLPTRSDTWGLVINEAMTYGLPVITTDMCVAGDALIKNDVNGYIVKTEDYVGLRQAIDILLDNSDKITEFGRLNFELMRNWTFEDMGEQVYGCLREMYIMRKQ